MSKNNKTVTDDVTIDTKESSEEVFFTVTEEAKPSNDEDTGSSVDTENKSVEDDADNIPVDNTVDDEVIDNDSDEEKEDTVDPTEDENEDELKGVYKMLAGKFSDFDTHVTNGDDLSGYGYDLLVNIIHTLNADTIDAATKALSVITNAFVKYRETSLGLDKAMNVQSTWGNSAAYLNKYNVAIYFFNELAINGHDPKTINLDEVVTILGLNDNAVAAIGRHN